MNTRGLSLDTSIYQPSGWVEIESSITQALGSYTTENSLKFNGGWIEVRHYHLLRPVEAVWSTSKSSYFLDICLAPTPESLGRLVSLPRLDDFESRGHIQIVPPGQKVHARTNGGNFRSMRCVLEAQFIDGLLEQPAYWCENSIRSAFKQSGGALEWLLMKIYQELKEPQFGTKTVVEAYARAIAVEVIRKFKLEQKNAPKPKRTGGLAPWRMKLLKQRIYAEQTPPSLDELADLCSINVRHLTRAFKEETGETLGKFVKSVVIERARTLLLESDLPIHKIAEMLGYSSSGSFAYTFRQATGLLPSDIERKPKRAGISGSSIKPEEDFNEG